MYVLSCYKSQASHTHSLSALVGANALGDDVLDVPGAFTTRRIEKGAYMGRTTHICIYVNSTYICNYIYIQRERERQA